jgi:predicted HAD superfamily phosphohydrolase YqeG
MTPAEVRMLTTMIRRNQVLRAERMALLTIIKRSVHVRQVPTLWKTDLENIRKSPGYRALVQELDTTLSQVEQSADQAELADLLKKLSKDALPN